MDTTFGCKKYNSLPLLDGSQSLGHRMPDTKQVTELSRLCQNLGLGHIVSLVRTHRHFELKENECVVWKRDKDMLVARARPIAHGEFLPITWSFSGRDVAPLEYCNINDLEQDSLESLRSSQTMNSIARLGSEIVGYGLAEEFGISALSLLLTQADHFTEYAYPDCMRLKVSEKPESGAITTNWKLDSDMLRPLVDCCSCH